jgi:predicted transcriptional regulator
MRMAELEITRLHLDRPGIRAALGDLEAEIMEIVWARPVGEAITVRDVFETLYERRRIAYTTVMNTMARLARKGLLIAERKEPAYIYRAALTRDEFIERLVGGALEKLLVNFSSATRAHLARIDDPAVQARLARLLQEITQRRQTEEAD